MKKQPVAKERIIMKPVKKKRVKILISILLSVVILLAGCGIYLGDYYKADENAISVMVGQNAKWEETDEGNLVFVPENASAGLIFYPGGKVEHSSYIPLMNACTERGILCIIVKMPFNLAVFDINAADGLREQYPQAEKWYIGGHSLGGSMAASYLSDNREGFEGLILLGSYSTADLSDSDLDVLSMYGSEDHVMNREKYEEGKANLPEGFREIIIDGGCHAYFGTYGEQDGDGKAEISNIEQIDFTAEQMSAFMQG